MKRSMSKAIADYQRKFRNNDSFFVSDIQQIADLGGDKWDYITNALQAGFMLGYKYHQRKQKTRSQVTGACDRDIAGAS